MFMETTDRNVHPKTNRQISRGKGTLASRQTAQLQTYALVAEKAFTARGRERKAQSPSIHPLRFERSPLRFPSHVLCPRFWCVRFESAQHPATFGGERTLAVIL